MTSNALVLLMIFMRSVVTSAMETEGALWTREHGADQKVVSATWIFPARSVLYCAKSCGQKQNSCPRFSYDKFARVCYLDPVLTTGSGISEVHFLQVSWETTTQEMATQEMTIEMTTQEMTTVSPCASRADYTMLTSGQSCIKSYLNVGLKTWVQSRNYCITDGARLVSMQTVSKKSDIEVALRAIGVYGNTFWLGGSDISSEGDYRWVDGTRIANSLFAGGAPSGRSIADEDCVQSRSNLDLNDNECDASFYFICEIMQN